MWLDLYKRCSMTKEPKEASEKVLLKLPDSAIAGQQVVKNKTIAIIGYGNQGSSQAQNLRDNGYTVIVGNIEDDSRLRAEKEKFQVFDIADASKKADILFVLIPDEIQAQTYRTDIQPNLSAGKTLVFASGYNYFYHFIDPEKYVNVLMLAPRMIGWAIRDLYLKGMGYPVLGAIGHDYTGDARLTMMILAEGIGALKPGGCLIESSFREETLLDLLTEHSWCGALSLMFRAYYEITTELGCSPESIILELYGSGELAEVAESMKNMGLYKQLRTHSHTSQYGQLTRGPKYVNDSFKLLMKECAQKILDGTFAREWTIEQSTGMTVYRKLHETNAEHPMEKEEEKLYRQLGRIPKNS